MLIGSLSAASSVEEQPMKRARGTLLLLFAGILCGMLWVTVRASLACPLWSVSPALTQDPWFHATLADAYFGFLTFFVWVCVRERSLAGRATWFVLIMCLGNIAMSCYMLWRIWSWDTQTGWSGLWLAQVARTPLEG